MTRISFDSFKIHDAGESAVTMRVINSATHNLGIQTTGPDSGNPYNEERFIAQQNETFDLRSTALESLLNTINLLTGKCIENGGSEPGLELYGQAHDPCGTSGRTSGSTNMLIAAPHAHLLITNISGNAGQDAEASVRALLLTDGTNPPSSAVFNAALPASPIDDEVFVVGQPTVAGTALSKNAVRSVSIDTGIDIEAVTDVGSIYPGVVIVKKAAPTIRIIVDDISGVDTLLGESGIACTLANSKVTFAKRNPKAGILALTASEHIEIAFEGMAYLNDKFNASGREVGTAEIIIECIEPASGVPLTVTTDTNLE